MKLRRLHTMAATGLAAAALTAAGSVALPGKAHAIDPVTGALVGGAVVGAIAGSVANDGHTTVYTAPPPVYAAPRVYEAPPTYTYSTPVVVEECRYETRQVYDAYQGGYYYERVRVC